MEQTAAGTAKGQGRSPPYVSYKTLKTFAQALHEEGVPNRIDRSILKRFSGTVGNQLLTALRFLDLIDANDRPTDGLRSLASSAGSDAWPDALGSILRASYGPVFDVGLDHATWGQVQDAFRAYPGSEEVRRKCLVFFLSAAQEANIPVSKRVIEHLRQRDGTARKRATKEPKAGTGNGPAPRREDPRDGDDPAQNNTQNNTQNHPAKDPAQVLLDILDPEDMDETQQDAVWTLLKYLKSKKVQTAA